MFKKQPSTAAIEVLESRRLMSVDLVGATTGSNGDGYTSVSSAKPLGTAIGDVMVAVVTGRAADVYSVSWTSIYRETISTKGGGDFVQEAFYRVVNSEP